MNLTDGQWSAIWHLFPPPRKGRGRPRVDSRRVMDGVLWKIRTTSPWRALPSRYPPHQTCYRFYCEWVNSDLLSTVITFLYSDLIYRGRFTPYQAVAEKRITLQIKERSFKFFIAPRFQNDWRTNTALLFLQLELSRALKRIIIRSKKGRLLRRSTKNLTFEFHRWNKFAPMSLSGPDPETYSGPEDITFEL